MSQVTSSAHAVGGGGSGARFHVHEETFEL
jgi:hypothetical protein